VGKLVFLSVMISACAAAPRPSGDVVGPSATDQEAALEIVWEGVYGMEVASRPASITWWPSDGCGEDLNITGATVEGACAADSEGSKGYVYIRWEGSISASNFSRALVMWRQYLMTGAMTKPSADDFSLVNAAQDELGAGGL